jgi:2'-5' RNA ligase
VDTYRTFIAIELPRALRAKLIEHIAQLRRELPDTRASWSREDNLHLTLKFLGNVPGSEIPKLSAAIARAVSGMKPFELTVASCGVFPPRGRPNVLWIGVEDGSAGILPAGRGHLARTSLSETILTPSPLALFHQRIEDECANVGFAREPRSFHPHLTIARLRKTGDERRLAEGHKNFAFPPETFSVSEVVVFKSDLLPQGSRHTPISRHPLHQ